MLDLSSVIAELRRRNVFRVATIYGVVAWGLIQIVETTFPYLGLPDWTITFVIVLTLAGFPIALVLAWAFEVTPAGVRRTAAAETEASPPSRRPGGDRHRALTAGVVLGFLLAGVGLGTYGWVRPHEEPVLAATELGRGAVAVLPFSYHGSPEHEYLGEGIIDLLGTQLDGVGGLRSIDPHALLSVLRQEGGDEVLGPATARSIARRLGASRFILGSVTEVGGRMQLRATLHDSRGEPVATAQVGPAEEPELFEAVDELARALLVHELEATGDPLPSLAARTTSSIPALKFYLEGERLLRHGRSVEAGESFEEAIAQDSTFALAYFGLAVSQGWGHAGSSRETIERALALGDHLPQREQSLLRAYAAFRTGEHRTAERLYRAIVAEAPEHVAAWYGLGDLLFHYAPLSGRTPSAAREPFERVLSLVPDHFHSLFHLASVAAFEGRPAELSALTERMLESNASRDYELGARVQPALLYGDSAEFTRALREFGGIGASSPNWIWTVSAHGVAAAFDGDLDRARRVAATGLSPAGSSGEQAYFRRVMASLELAGGRWKVAREWLAGERGRSLGAVPDRTRPAAMKDWPGRLEVTEMRPSPGPVDEAHLAVSPFLPVPEAELRALRDRLRAAPIPPGASTENGGVPGAWSYRYLLGLLSARLGEEDAALAHAGALEALPAEPSLGSLQDDLAAAIRAYSEHVQGRPERALAVLEGMRLEFPMYPFLLSRTGGLAPARFLRAELLHALGRSEEALRQYEAAMHGNLHAVFYAAPGHLRMAEIHDARGEGAEAIRHYERAIRLWKDAGPELQPRVAEARRRLQRLEADGAD